MDSLLDYNTSPLNPALKIIITLAFLAVLGIYLYSRRFYSDKIRGFINVMILFALCAVAVGIIRFFGDGIPFGFTTDFSLKLFQSLAMVAEAGCFILAGRELLNLIGDEGK